ncbi:efflux RND transporter periplasmic adaptor subunit [Thalassotalea euphylliae]|uniref:efflux RND transporter periplasmic adaptor subunit n=1 Tax=Thalassotalea euphylliae TaxID=1655234 RepID=UPI003632A7C6
MHIKRWFVALFIISVTIGGLGFFKFQQIQAAMAMAASFPEPSATVKTEVTELSQFNPSYQVNGQIVAKRIVTLQNELPGVITQLDMTPGSQATKGQLLLSLNVSEETAQLDSAKARLKLAANNFDRMAALIKEDKVSQQQYDQAEADYFVAKADIANLESIIAKKQITAPFSGKVGLEAHQLGQFLSANSAITTLVGDDSDIWVDFNLPQTQSQPNIGDQVIINAIRQGKKVVELNATVIARKAAMQVESRHITYRAEIKGGSESFVHNELVKVTVGGQSQQVVVVPNSAVIRDAAGAYVYTLEEDNNKSLRANKVAVTLGKRFDDNLVITSGLAPNLLIATQGAFKLHPGLLVYVEHLPTNSLSAQLLKEAL